MSLNYENNEMKSENKNLVVQAEGLHGKVVQMTDKLGLLEQTVASDKLKFQTYLLYNKQTILDFLINEVSAHYDRPLQTSLHTYLDICFQNHKI